MWRVGAARLPPARWRQISTSAPKFIQIKLGLIFGSDLSAPSASRRRPRTSVNVAARPPLPVEARATAPARFNGRSPAARKLAGLIRTSCKTMMMVIEVSTACIRFGLSLSSGIVGAGSRQSGRLALKCACKRRSATLANVAFESLPAHLLRLHRQKPAEIALDASRPAWRTDKEPIGKL